MSTGQFSFIDFPLSTSSSLVLFSPQHAPNDIIQQADENVSTE